MNIIWLDDTGCQEVSRVGGKVANLSRLAAEYQVPPRFCLTTDAFQEWAGHADGCAEELPSELLHQLSDAYGELAQRSDVEKPSVAVPSSAIDEDGGFASFAGQYETYLNLEGDAAVAAAVLRCWHSTRAERVTEYRQRAGLALDRLEMAVLVQELVPADSSAVIFSANPVTQNRGEVVINASWGLGAPLSANVRETRSTQRIRVGRRQRKRTCWDCEREWKRMVVPLEPGRPSEARQLLRTQR